MGASTYSHATTPNSKVPDNINGCDAAATGRMKCVEITPGTPEEGDTFAAARSSHDGGVNVVFADGSAKFYTDRVEPRANKRRKKLIALLTKPRHIAKLELINAA